jgi:maltooligosyltrehalose trehalohydrolase
MTTEEIARRLPIGAELLPSGGVEFGVWAGDRRQVEVAILGGPGAASDGQERLVSLNGDEHGYFRGVVPEAGPGTLYKFRLDGEAMYPDPVSRFQPEGPHGPSEVIDPGQFQWTDSEWKGASIEGQVIYEMHIGSFTKEGDWEAAIRQFPELADLGVTVLEVMPVSEFPGEFGWGYDGVYPYAPYHHYGRPDDMRRFVDRAHAHGMAVILDVVYNHFGPDGCFFTEFSQDYFTDRYTTDWGSAINFDDRNAHPVREYFVANAEYWVKEFHMDGLRLDATQNIYDFAKGEHILTAIVNKVREAAGGRKTIVIGENEPQEVRMVKPPEEGGYGLDALWNDDFHHSAMVALTGNNDAYYTDYLGKPQEFISAVKYGFLYQGQWYKWQKKRRGSQAFGLKPGAFVCFIQNHDQVANSARGLRCNMLTSLARFRAMTALLLLAPGTPMLFQGQEFAASSPFYFFADHKEELAKMVAKGRREFLSQWRTLRNPEIWPYLTDPAKRETFERCKLDFSERHKNWEIYQMHRDLLQLRREDPVFRAQQPGGVDGAVLGPGCFVLRYFGQADAGDRLLLVNFGVDLHLDPSPEPLLGPPEKKEWGILWSSENPRYGGVSTAPPDSEENWRIPGNAAVVLEPRDPKAENKQDSKEKESR